MEGEKNKSYIYQVELLLEDEDHASAFEQLIHKLNEAKFIDYKVLAGIALGDEIQSRKQKASEVKNVPIAAKESSKSQKKAAKAEQASQLDMGIEAIKLCKDKNKLIRLIVNRGLGIKLSIPCRVINVDEKDFLVTVYHVDEKQVYTFRLSEIEDFIEA